MLSTPLLFFQFYNKMSLIFFFFAFYNRILLHYATERNFVALCNRMKFMLREKSHCENFLCTKLLAPRVLTKTAKACMLAGFLNLHLVLGCSSAALHHFVCYIE